MWKVTIGLSKHAAVAVLILTMATTVRADDLVLYAAGSLREAMPQITGPFGQAHGVTVSTQFDSAGRLRERIEKGERVDLFASADVAQARKLLDGGRASVIAVFTRNTVCLLSPKPFAATTQNALDKMLVHGVRLGVAPPKIDPLGVYTERLFDAAEALRSNNAAALRAHAVVVDNAPGVSSKTGDPAADAILAGRIDAAIVYCSSRDRFARLLPDATLVNFPPQLRVGPEYALAVLKDARPGTQMLALAILSPAGQRILAEHGFQPVGLPAE